MGKETKEPQQLEMNVGTQLSPALKAAQELQPTEADNINAWGAAQPLGQDVIIPKILPMQPSSDLVTDGKAAIGEFRDSVTGAKLGSIVEPIHVIPFHVQKVWDIQMENDGGQFEWVETIPLIEDPVSPGYNDNLQWRDTLNGKNIRRFRRMNFFVLLPSEVEAGTSMPYIFSFKSTSFVEGKKVYSQMYMRNRRSQLPPPAFTFKISGTKEKNDKGTFIVPKVELDRASNKAEINEAFGWYKQIAKGNFKADDSDIVKDAESMPEGSDTGTGNY